MTIQPFRCSLLLLTLAGGCHTAPKPPPPSPSQAEASAAAHAFARGDLPSAEKKYRSALMKARASGDSFQTAAVLYNLSGCLLAQNRAADARIMLDQLNPAFFPRGRLSDFTLLQARVDLALGSLEKAQALLMDLPASNPQVLITLAELRLLQNRPDEARIAAASLDDSMPEQALLLGRIESLAGKQEVAASLFQRAATAFANQRRPRDAAQASDLFAQALAKAQRPGEAAAAYLFAAQSWFGLGDLNPAALAIEKSVELAPSVPDPALQKRIASFATEMDRVVRSLAPARPD